MKIKFVKLVLLTPVIIFFINIILLFYYLEVDDDSIYNTRTNGHSINIDILGGR